MFPTVFGYLSSLGLSQESQDLIASSKTVFPFEQISSLDFLRDCKTIPTIDKFASLLRGDKTGNAKDYDTFTKIWNALNVNNLLQLFNIYIG